MMQLVLALVYLYWGCGLSNADSTLTSRIPDLLNHLCPGSDVCTSNRTYHTADDITFRPGTGSCCAECSCLADCSETGNCCFPKTSEEEYVENLEDFGKGISCLFPMLPQPTRNLVDLQSYSMVSSVLTNVTGSLGEQSNKSCGDIDVAPWGSLYPVSSAKTKQIYKNIECAREDGADTDVIMWDVLINCADVETTIDAARLNRESIPEYCRIDFVFPGSSDLLKSLKCYPNLIDTCSESQDFNVPDGTNISKEDIRTLCAHSGFVSPYRALKMYANVFCHICNADYFSQRTICSESVLASKSRVGFTVLINEQFITSSRTNHREKEQLACSYTDKDKCRPVLCPTGQLRDISNKCVYPGKVWYNQVYGVYVNLTLDTFINVSQVFNITGLDYISYVLPPITSEWLKRWSVASIFYKEMDVAYMSNNLLINVQRQISSVKPNIFIKSIKSMVKQPWSIDLSDITKDLKSSNFSKRRLSVWESQDQGDFYNLTENLETSKYKAVYFIQRFFQSEHIITELYYCNQVELLPSEFVLNSYENIVYIYATKRFLFDNQFAVIGSDTSDDTRVRICIEDSGLYERSTIKNAGTSIETFDFISVLSSVLSTLIYRIIC